ncbi:hydrogenase assembly chaperone HypC/HupF [Paraburkholderia xenovorans LB400]|uniref:Hydrogenase expression/formation protein, HupF/HypC n=1 Tax=Paraburkholderia xenovorans (strain LB400) TaxID=266265 RepID=Q13HK3_PARXL|nr:HypC/HybG/HupF family hydrogenase formation chaperone [Paraburkholderia xenovorans]ABE36436.1 Hydrogenase expression/formation protein, HupF/HypC [Paraburkholderia xenovorans LB400]AIP34864.1 hydrogenase assembly chaperone HypC/HupF [Paraburkholderia xenovorans LB400]
MCLGIPGQIIAIHDAVNKLALVEVSGVRRLINIAFIVDEDLPAAAYVGDWVLIHVGFAMSRLDEAEAMHTLALLRELGESDELDDRRIATDAFSATGSTP